MMRSSWLLLPLAFFIACTGDDPDIGNGPVASPSDGGGADGGDGTTTPDAKKLTIAEPSAISVVHGTTAKVKVSITRTGFTGDVIVEAPSVPTGVRIDPITIKDGASEGELSIDTQADAPQSAVKVKLDASSTAGVEKTSALLALTVRGRAGELDTTFAGGSVAAGAGAASDLATDTAGNLYVLSSGGVGTCLVRRFTRDGQADMNFATSGVATFASTQFSCHAMAVQEDGKIVLVGTQLVAQGVAQAARILASGMPDTTFGEDPSGVVTISGVNALSAVEIDANKRIIVVGRSNEDLAVRRLLETNGSLDSAFTNTTAAGMTAGAIAFAPGGSLQIVGGIEPSMTLATISPNGDATVPKTQLVTLDFPVTTTERATTLAIDATGVVFVGGVAFDSAERFVVTRVAGGVQDTAYGNAGWFTLPVVGAAVPGPVLAEAAGQVLLLATAGSPSKVVLSRVKADGEIETAFGDNGMQQTSVEAIAVAGARLQDERVVAAVTKPAGGAALVRFWR